MMMTINDDNDNVDYPESYKTKRIHHREIFESRVQYHHVIEFESETTLKQIHLAFRLMYIRVSE